MHISRMCSEIGYAIREKSEQAKDNDFELLATNESLSDLDVLLICSRSRLNELNSKVAKSHHQWCFK